MHAIRICISALIKHITEINWNTTKSKEP